MKLEICNIWDKHAQGEMICIPSNGFITANGLAVMGRGVAAQAVKRFPSIKQAMADAILLNGNVVQRILGTIVSFPVKPQLGICNKDKSNVVRHMRSNYQPFSWVPGYAMMADTNIIENSLWQLHRLYDYGFFDKIYLPKPGCGAGGLKWDDVAPYCEQYGDWLIICDIRK